MCDIRVNVFFFQVLYITTMYTGCDRLRQRMTYQFLGSDGVRLSDRDSVGVWMKDFYVFLRDSWVYPITKFLINTI